jgi:hypothetical protein
MEDILNNEDNYVTVKELVEILGLLDITESEAVVRNWIKEGKYSVEKYDKKKSGYKISSSSVELIIREKRPKTFKLLNDIYVELLRINSEIYELKSLVSSNKEDKKKDTKKIQNKNTTMQNQPNVKIIETTNNVINSTELGKVSEDEIRKAYKKVLDKEIEETLLEKVKIALNEKDDWLVDNDAKPYKIPERFIKKNKRNEFSSRSPFLKEYIRRFSGEL